MPTKATWKNGNKTETGNWYYDRGGDVFYITLDSIDPITEQRRRLETSNDHPEWGNWKLVKEEKNNQ